MSGSQNATISFNEIPYAWEVPGTWVETRPNYSNAGLTPFPAKVLLIGQMLASGTQGTAGTIYSLQRSDQAAALFGNGSVAADMAKAFLAANPFTQVDIVALADPAGAKAAGSITVTGSSSTGGTLVAYIAGIRVAIAVSTTDAQATIASNLLAAINAIPEIPVVATITTPTNRVTLTAKHAGTVGNQIDVRLNYMTGEVTPAGLTTAIVAMTGGTLNPDITSVINAIAATWYTDLVLPTYDSANMAVLTAALTTRYAAMGKLDSHAWLCASGTYGTLLAQAASYNSPYRTVLGVTNAPQPPWKWAASMAGVAVFQLTNDPARQLRGLALPGILPPAPADRMPIAEQQLLLVDGISTFDVLADGTVVLQKVVTEYQTTNLGVPDTAWHNVMTPKTLTRIRYDWIGTIGRLYPRNKLSDDGSIAAEYDDTIVTPSRLKGTWAARCRLYEQLGWIEGSQATAAASVFVRDGTDRNRVNARQQLRIIGNLMVLTAALEFQV